MRLRIREKKVLCISTYLSRYWTYQIPTEASRNKYSLGLCHTTRPSTFHIPSRNVVQDMARCNVRFFFREDHGLIIIIIFFFFFLILPIIILIVRWWADHDGPIPTDMGPSWEDWGYGESKSGPEFSMSMYPTPLLDIDGMNDDIPFCSLGSFPCFDLIWLLLIFDPSIQSVQANRQRKSRARIRSARLK